MVFATSYPRIHFKLHFDYFWGRGGLRYFVSAYPLQTTPRLFLGEGWPGASGDCDINFEGSSPAMEAEGALETGADYHGGQRTKR